MYRILDKRASGKTSRLFLLAKENNGTIVCSCPNTMRDKAYRYGITGLNFISYKDYIIKYAQQENLEEMCKTKYYIDELEGFLKFVSINVDGYTLSIED